MPKTKQKSNIGGSKTVGNTKPKKTKKVGGKDEPDAKGDSVGED